MAIVHTGFGLAPKASWKYWFTTDTWYLIGEGQYEGTDLHLVPRPYGPSSDPSVFVQEHRVVMEISPTRWLARYHHVALIVNPGDSFALFDIAIEEIGS